MASAAVQAESASASLQPFSGDKPVGEHAMVTFFTTTFPKAMPEQSFIVPLSTLPDGLSTLVESVLGAEGQRFDFLLNDEYISTSLEKFLRRRGISYEELLNIEYTPSLQAKEGALLPHDDWVSSVRAPVVGSAEILLTGSYDHCVRVWSGDTCVAVGAQHTECVKAVCVRPHSIVNNDPSGISRKRTRVPIISDFECVSGGKDGTVVAWRYDGAASQLRMLGTAALHVDSVDDVDISSSGDFIASASWDATVKVFEWRQLVDTATAPAAKAPLVTFTDHTRPVLACRFSATDGSSRVYSAGLDGSVKCLCVEQAQLISEHRGDHSVQGLAVRPSSGADLLLAASTDNRVRLYDTREKAVVQSFSGHRQWVYAATWLWRRDEEDRHGPCGFATASEDGTVRVWDMRSTAAALLTLDSMHTDGVLDVTYAGESQIVSCGKDNRTRSFSLTNEATS